MIIQSEKFYRFLEKFNSKLSIDRTHNFFQFIEPINPQLFERIFILVQKSNNFFYWDFPESNESFFCFDEIYSSQSEEDLNLLNILSNRDEYGIEYLPEIIISKKFPLKENFQTWNDFQDSMWFIPRLLFFRKNESYYLSLFLASGEINNCRPILNDIDKLLDDMMEKEFNIFSTSELLDLKESSMLEWQLNVESALQHINTGKVNKVVISRMIEYSLSRLPDFKHLATRLKQEYPSSYIFIYKQKSSFFFGASPEKLFKINRNQIETEALAGTVKRGGTFQEDELISKIFSDDRKEMREHHSVVEYIVNKLSEFASDISYNTTPKIKKLKYIQHLWTPIKARLNSNPSVFSIIEKLHPTPAICGEPKEEAILIIKELEKFDRGLFAGIIGWYNKNGFGEFTVAIRSGLIKENKLLLYAGCGIVEGSTPEQEYRETELKLKSILSLFENENTY